MIKKQLEMLYSRLGKSGVTEERDRQLIGLLKQFEALDDSQKKQVLPHLEKTLSRHEEIGASLAVIRRFLFHLDEAAEEQRARADKISSAGSSGFH